MSDKISRWIQISREVQLALDAGRPVVALESTLIAHGLPHPQNLEAARMLEGVIRDGGATPATIAVIAGTIKVGLNEDDLMRLARGKGVRKLSRRDLPVAIARGEDGATTVAATMAVAELAGIDVFATGGIGGVHRGQSLDISADLPELARTPVIVVCAGAKAILDLPRTLEWLETHSVPVLGYGTDTFPAFYLRSSGLPVAAQVDTPQEIAGIWRAMRAMGSAGGILVTVPIPAAHALPPAMVESVIQMALQDARAAGVRGPRLTPYLLARIAELTGGRSVAANIALLRNNATVAATIAVAVHSSPPG